MDAWLPSRVVRATDQCDAKLGACSIRPLQSSIWPDRRHGGRFGQASELSSAQKQGRATCVNPPKMMQKVVWAPNQFRGFRVLPASFDAAEAACRMFKGQESRSFQEFGAAGSPPPERSYILWGFLLETQSFLLYGNTAQVGARHLGQCLLRCDECSFLSREANMPGLGSEHQSSFSPRGLHRGRSCVRMSLGPSAPRAQ